MERTCADNVSQPFSCPQKGVFPQFIAETVNKQLKLDSRNYLETNINGRQKKTL